MTIASPLTLPSAALLDHLLHNHQVRVRPRLDRLWQYYRNPESADAAGPAQTRGLPRRLTHPPAGVERAVVIENDIAWRVHALVDFMFGQPLIIQSVAPDAGRSTQITDYLRRVFAANGGQGLFHDLALLGAVHGHVDLLVRPRPHPRTRKLGRGGTADVRQSDSAASAREGAAASELPGVPGPGVPGVGIELIEAPRAVPLLDPGDYRRLDAYLIHHDRLTHELDPGPWLGRVLPRGGGPRRRTVQRTECWTAGERRVYIEEGRVGGHRRRLIEQQVNRLGRIPVVHIQNLAQPFAYEGLSDVEPLIPLQDELNTRLSDRANRVTFQSFKMYLGKGIEGFTERPVGPGQMWSTDDPDAAIHEFGGDAATPSEDAHIRDIREALDKASGVSPIAAGVVGGKTGNLSSENAIRIVLLGLLARIEKKRLTYGGGIERLCELILHTADVTGELPNAPEERRVRLDWPTPFPDSEQQQLQNALVKQRLGVPREQLLTELGYADCPPAGA
jgi:hypothetical protein